MCFSGVFWQAGVLIFPAVSLVFLAGHFSCFIQRLLEDVFALFFPLFIYISMVSFSSRRSNGLEMYFWVVNVVICRH